MAGKKEDKKEKKVYHPCQYCNRGLKSKQGLVEHEKSCLLNPANQQPKFESSEIAQKITPEMEEKIKEKINSNSLTQQFLMDGLKEKQLEIEQEGRDLTSEENSKFEEVLDFVKRQKENKEEIEQDKLTAEKIKGKSKIMNAVSELEGLKSGDKMGLQESLAFAIIQDTIQGKRLNEIFMQERIKKLNEPDNSNVGLTSLTSAIISGVLNQNNTLLQQSSQNKQDDPFSTYIKVEDSFKRFAKEKGLSKSDESSTERMMVEGFSQLMPLLNKWLDVKKSEQQNPQSFREMPSGQLSQTSQEAPQPDNVFQEGGRTAPPQIEPSDSELMRMDFLHDESTPNLEYSYPFSNYTDFSNKPKTSPMTASP